MRYLKFTGNLLIILCISIMLGILLLALVYAIPVEAMEKQANISGFLLAMEGSYPVFYESMLATKIDNWVNVLMINTAVYDGPQGFLEKIIRAYTVRYEEENLIFSLLHYFSDDQSGAICEPYTRYWHGYLIFLKPFLLFFSIEEIRTVHLSLMGFLTAITAFQLKKQHLERYIIPYISSILFLLPFVLYKTMLYYGVFYLVQISCIFLIHNHRWLIEQDRYRYFFFIIGIICCYVDILSFPLLSLGMPLVFYFLLEKHQTIRETTSKFLSYSLLWSAGFFCMWAGKWLVASIYSRSFAPFQEAFYSLSERSGTMDYTTGMEFSRFDAIWINVETAFEPAVCLFVLIGILILILHHAKCASGRFSFQWHPVYAGLCFIFCMPFVWYFFTANHSYLHAFYTYRILGMSVFALLSALAFPIPEARKQQKLYSKKRNT